MNTKFVATVALFLVLGAAAGWILFEPADTRKAESKKGTVQATDGRDESHIEMAADKAAKAGIEITTAGAATLQNRLQLYGRIGFNDDQLIQVRPRFPGVVRTIRKKLGDEILKNEIIATVESNQSLTSYDIRSPLAGTVVEKGVSLGEYVSDQTKMFVVANLENVWVDFSVYTQDSARVRKGQAVTVAPSPGVSAVNSTISYVSPLGAADTQTLLARVVMDNPARLLRPGLSVIGEVTLDDIQVPIAVATEALQTIDGHSVVFVRDGESFEVRPIELGRRDAKFSEVLNGLQPGERYATRNSFVVKAELGKSSAAEE